MTSFVADVLLTAGRLKKIDVLRVTRSNCRSQLLIIFTTVIYIYKYFMNNQVVLLTKLANR